MKNKLLTISVLTILLASGQSAIADTSDNDFTPFDPQAINQIKDNRFNITTASSSSDADLMKASMRLNNNGFYSIESENPFSLNYSNDK